MQADPCAPDFQAVAIRHTRNTRECLRRNRRGQKQQAEDQGESQQENVRIWFQGMTIYAIFLLSCRRPWVESQRLTHSCADKDFTCSNALSLLTQVSTRVIVAYELRFL